MALNVYRLAYKLVINVVFIFLYYIVVFLEFYLNIFLSLFFFFPLQFCISLCYCRFLFRSIPVFPTRLSPLPWFSFFSMLFHVSWCPCSLVSTVPWCLFIHCKSRVRVSCLYITNDYIGFCTSFPVYLLLVHAHEVILHF